MAETKPQEQIKNIVRGNTDPFGYKIENVLSRGNEYAIYEVDVPDINSRVRVLIDGITDESEKALIKKYNEVKPKYIEAKGLLYRSTNYGMMKQRVANVLGSVLSSDEDSKTAGEAGNAEFDRLISTIKNEIKGSIKNRILYLVPCVVTTVALFLIARCYMELRLIPNDPSWQMITAALAASLGGSMSILYNVKKLNFEEYTNGWFCPLLGAERIFLAMVAGAIAFILIKARFLLPDMVGRTYWGVMAILVAAAFSEAMIPSALAKIEKKTSGS